MLAKIHSFFNWNSYLFAFVLLTVNGTQAQQIEYPNTASLGNPDEHVVEYTAGYFGRFKPNTALDMVSQVPGFVLDDINNNRGFSASAGNVLIDGRRPSTKDDALSAILGRIPAGQVQRIELIRGQVRGVDLRGHTVVANVILVNDSPAVVRWEVGARRNTLVDRLLFRGNVSLYNSWGGIDYNFGINGERSSTGEDSNEDVFNSNNNLVERRIDDSVEHGYKGNSNLNLSTWLGHTLVQFNSKISVDIEDEPKESYRSPLVAGLEPRTEIFFDDRNGTAFEIGITAERIFATDLLAKTIFLYDLNDRSVVSDQTTLNQFSNQTFFRTSESNVNSDEVIARLEFDWTGFPSHSLQVNVEGAYNSLDSTYAQVDDDGTGPVNVVVPGSNTRVEEYRGDFLLRDNWSLGPVEVDYGLGAEVSTIKQTGDTNLKRNFFFLKPHGVMTWSQSPNRQYQLRIAREISQLNFQDFVSASNFQDNDLALGNPNLRPDATWILEVGHERRFTLNSVVKLTAFHHWISDVLDLLPVTSTFEAPGNIGDGRRWGIILESTIPLEWSGLTGAKVNIKARWQDSTVVDPVTGQNRKLSGRKGFGGNPYISFNDENRYAVILDYRQDFQEEKVAWGANVGTRAGRTVFNVNETDIYDEGVAINAFIETTRWWGLKLRLIGENLTNLSQVRERTIFTGERGLSPVDIKEVSEELEGIRVTLAMSGSF